ISKRCMNPGLRICDDVVLQWRDVDLVSGTISITKTVLRITNIDASQTAKTKVVIQAPKTQASIRIIPIPDRIMGYLQVHKSEDKIYLASGKTTFTEPRQHQYQFRKILSQAGIPYHKFHVLRHTFATRCIEQGVDVKSLSEILGHSSVTITMQRYVHPSLEMKRTQINKLTQI
ncbi:MAG: site-specific integrase, partial [Lachnospiraceae bacterium]|nr:site-specific integrase [Lachnospiraceae bacterium]